MDGEIETRVECYSGHEYAERPTAFDWMGERKLVVIVLEQHHTPRGKLFLVKTQEDERFQLEYDQREDRWRVKPG